MQIISERTLKRIDRAVENGKIIPFLALATLANRPDRRRRRELSRTRRLRQPRRCALVVRADRDDGRLRRRRSGVVRWALHRRLHHGLRRGIRVADNRARHVVVHHVPAAAIGWRARALRGASRSTRAHRAAARLDGSNLVVQADQHAAADDESGAGDKPYADALRRAENDRRQRRLPRATRSRRAATRRSRDRGSRPRTDRRTRGRTALLRERTAGRRAARSGARPRSTKAAIIAAPAVSVALAATPGDDVGVHDEPANEVVARSRRRSWPPARDRARAVGTCSGRSRSLARRNPPATISTAPTASAASSGSPRTTHGDNDREERRRADHDRRPRRSPPRARRT